VKKKVKNQKVQKKGIETQPISEPLSEITSSLRCRMVPPQRKHKHVALGYISAAAAQCSSDSK